MTAIRIHGLTGIDEAARDFMRLCKNRYFFAFYGSLGAGKTTFIKALCRVLGSKDNVVSPTFSLVNEYQAPQDASGASRIIYHMDFYRLRNLNEALDIGVHEYFKKENCYCFIEWPELVESLLPDSTVRVSIEKQDDDSRIIKIDAFDSRLPEKV